MHRDNFLHFQEFWGTFNLPNFQQNSEIKLKFSETLNFNNSDTTSKKEGNNLIFRPMTLFERANFS